MEKWYFTDLDGTLLNENRTVDDIIHKNLQTVYENGCHVVMATGRSLEMCSHFGFLPEYFIGLNGALIYDTQGCIIHKCFLPPDVVQTLLKDFDDLHFEFYTEAGIFMTCSREDGIAYYTARQKARGRLWFSSDYDTLFRQHTFQVLPEEIARMNVLKANCFHADTEKCRRLESWIEERNDCINAPSDEVLFEITHKDAEKSRAVEWLKESLQLQEEQIYVFGDGINDVKMLDGHPNSYAPANALSCAAEAAAYRLGPAKAYSVSKFMAEDSELKI